MNRRAGWWLAGLASFACACAAQNMPRATLSDKPLSQRVVAYVIEARVDPAKHTLEGNETLTWNNLTGRAQDTFPFHLYLNAFQPTSTFIRETKLYDPDYTWREKNRGAITVTKLEVEGVGDLTSQMQFIAPDDGNRDDHSVFQVKLPRPVAAGQQVRFRIAFTDRFPEVLARTGYKRDFLMGAQWFPKVGVWWQGSWNCHQFHRDTEFFADFGTFDVKLTMPRNEVVGASGIQISSADNPDGSKTVRFWGEDIHDFAWTIEPEYKVLTDTFQGSMGTVNLRILVQPGHMSSAPRFRQALKGTLDRFDRWYGPYPYKQITLVDPPHGGLQAGGMEYPTLFTADTTWWMPAGLRFPEIVTEHEFGHQYWYGMVATNEFEDAWLDEGINSYTEVKIMDSLYGRQTSVLDFAGATASEDSLQRMQYVPVADDDPITRKAWQFMSANSYGGITYGKTATLLLTLEKVIGEETLRNALHTYFLRYRFTHPTREDFLKTLEEVAHQDLRWYFDQAVYGTQVMDYEITEVHSTPANWYDKNAKEKKGETTYHDSLVVHRKGDFIFPVDVLVTFDNGETARERWDGRDRWVRYQYDRRSKIASAQVDPGYATLLDKDFFNNGYTTEPHTGARQKLQAYYVVLTQWLAGLLGWLV